jgi:DNA polymerase-3 subunit delta'
MSILPTNQIYPWQEKNWQLLEQLYTTNFQNLLFISSQNIGSEIIIDKFINKLFCLELCGNCQNCRLLALKQHPDLIYLGQFYIDDKINVGKITVEDIRNMIGQVSLKPNFSHYKIVYITNCQLLNHNSANALLKILEEPPLYTKFILLSYNLNDLLPTITSRCRQILFNINYNQLTNDFLLEQFNYNKFWVNYYKYEPLNNNIINDDAIELLVKLVLQPSITNIYNVVDIFYKYNISIEFIINFKIKLIHDLLLVLNNQNADYLIGYNQNLKTLVKNIDLQKLYNFYDYLTFLFDWHDHPINYKLHLENIFFQYQSIFTK